MSSASRRAEFFALEANEYLADLDALAHAHDRPDAERLVRGARALRGAALMAGLGTYARAAAGLEAIARQVRDHALPWEPSAREAWVDGFGALRSLVARAATWEAADDRQALVLVDRFEQVMTGRPARSAATPPPALTPGVRAFIARESALIAGSFEQASRALAPVPPAAALTAVLERMQSLRGLGASGELSPLPELLDAMEVATRTLLADVPAPPGVASVFADAAHALSGMARAVAEAGRIVPSPELESIAQRLLASYATETDVVPIASLGPTGAESIARRGTPPSALPDADPIPVELVSVGDHLSLVADALARPASPAARDLKLFVLHRTLAAMPARSATGRFLAPLAHAITGAIGHHVATDRPDAFVAMLRGCGRFLVEAGSMNDRIALTNRRDAIATSLTMVGLGAPAGGFDLHPAHTAAAAPVAQPVAQDRADVIPLEALAPEPADTADRSAGIVAIETLAPEPDPVTATDMSDDVVAIANLAPEPQPASATDMSDDIVAIETLAPESGPDAAAAAPTDEIVAIESLAPDDEDVVPIEALAPEPEPTIHAYLIPETAPGSPSRLEAAFVWRRALQLAAAEGPPSLDGLIGEKIVAMTELLYRGRAALTRAEEVRTEIYGMLAEPAVSIDRLRPHIHELLDLVPLARDAA